MGDDGVGWVERHRARVVGAVTDLRGFSAQVKRNLTTTTLAPWTASRGLSRFRSVRTEMKKLGSLQANRGVRSSGRRTKTDFRKRRMDA